LPDKSEYDIAYLYGGNGGYGNGYSNTPAIGGNVLLYTDVSYPDNPLIPTNWLSYLNCTANDLQTKLYGSEIETISSWFKNTTFICAASGGNGAKST